MTLKKLDLNTPDFTDENAARIAELFPNCLTETVDEVGRTRRAIDFDLLKQELSADIVDGPAERYHLNWPGKREALREANRPIDKTLRPVRGESVDFDTTRNLFIEGDNLDALKLLQETYLGKVKMIYIDPPYNTGKDFIYRDNFTGDKGKHLEASGQVDEKGGKLVANPESHGRYHSDWLSMMYPRLKLARNLLREDGVIFISIGDDEQAALKQICDEIFGEQNFCAEFIWNTEGNTDNQYQVKVNHEYIVAYYRDSSFAEQAIGKVIDPNTPAESNLRKGYADNNINKNNPENPPSIVTLPVGFPSHVETLTYPAKSVDEEFFKTTSSEQFISDSIKSKYDIESKSGLPVKLDDMEVSDFKLVKPCRIYVGMANKNKLEAFIQNDCKPILDEGCPLEFYLNANAAVRYRRQNETPRNILSVLRNFGTTEKTKTSLKRKGIHYDYPKPEGLLSYLVTIGCEPQDGVVLDFFAGSSSTGDAVWQTNSEAGKKRKFILVQLPEQLFADRKEHHKALEFCSSNDRPHFLTEISKERLRVAGNELSGVEDNGFRVLKIDSSNMADVRRAAGETSQDDLLELVDNIKPDRTGEDLLFQVLLNWGVDLTLPIAREKLASKDVYFVAENALAACFVKGVDESLIKAIAARKPLRTVFRDDAFADDAMRINAEQLFKQLSPATELRVI